MSVVLFVCSFVLGVLGCFFFFFGGLGGREVGGLYVTNPPNLCLVKKKSVNIPTIITHSNCCRRS